MNSIAKKMTVALAMIAMLSVCAMPALATAPTYTTTAQSSHIVFADSYGVTVTVDRSYALGLDAAYWNWTVVSEPTAGIPDYTTCTNHTYYVHIHIYDGSTNLTKNVTLAVKNDAYIWSNASHANAAFGSMDTGASVYYIELIRGGNGTVTDYHGTVNLYANSAAAGMINAVMIVIPLIILVVIFGYFGKLTEGISGKIRRK